MRGIGVERNKKATGRGNRPPPGRLFSPSFAVPGESATCRNGPRTMTLRRMLPLLLAALLPAGVLAQAPPASPAPPETVARPVPEDHRGATVSTGTPGFRVGSLLGADVWSSDNHRLGRVEDVLFAPEGGSELTVVIGLGGLLGGTDRLVALPLSRLQHSERWVLPGVLPGTVGELPAFRFE